jgi:hypothetical protein
MDFSLRDNLLHLSETCLFRSPHDVPSHTSLDCLGAVVRRHIVSARDANGLCNHCGTSSLSTLDAICLLTHMGHAVHITEELECTDVCFANGTYYIPVYDAWSVSALVQSTVPDMVGVDQMVHLVTNAHQGFTIRVSHGDLGVPLFVRETLYNTIVSSPTFLLRVSHDDTPGATPIAARYMDRILVAVEHLDAHAPCGTFLVDERGSFDTFADGVASTALRPVSSVLLRSDMVTIVSASSVLLHLLTMLSSRWNAMLSNMWKTGTPDTLMQFLRHASTPDCIARCIDPIVLLSKTLRNERIDVLGMSLVRRMKCCDATRYADMRTSMITHHGVVRFDVIPIAASRFAHLYDIGVFDSMTACRTAVLVGTEARVMCVPLGTKTIQLTEAIATLLLGNSTDLSGERPPRDFVFGVIYQETSSQCPIPETLLSYCLVVDALSRTLRLEDSTEETFNTDDVLSVDELERMTIPCDASRTRRRDVAALFPEMAKRVELKSSEDTSACLREVQSRRVTREWGLDAMDAGRNMSGLGLTLMLHLLLSQWLGVRCRVAQSRSGAALLAVYVDGRYRLVDPCRTLRNFFSLSRELSNGAPPVPPREGMVVEIRQNSQWRVGVVRTVEVDRGSMIVQTAHKSLRVVVSLGTHGWRRVSRDDGSDLDHIVRPLLIQRKREREEKM